MKKNKMMRLASVLLIAVMVSTSAISGTYAKYVSEDFAKDTARVAKWGVTVTGSGDEAFGQKYNDAIEVAGTKVISAGSDDVIAPGTHGNAATITLAGEPEVAYKVIYTAKVEIEGDWTADGVFYFPLVIKNGATVLADGKNHNDITGFETELNAKLDALEGQNDAGVNAGGITAIDWEWPFSISEAYDLKDTQLGNKTVNVPHVTITITCRVEQVD